MLEEITIELTDYCPLRCIHCSSLSNIRCKNNLNKDIVHNIILEAKKSGVKKISFSGGEPTAHKSFVPILLFIGDNNLSIEVFTCGVNRNFNGVSTITKNFINKIKNINNLDFIFSIHGATAQIHDYITGVKGSFNIMLKSLENFLNAGISCQTNFVPLDNNIDQIREIIILLKQYNIKRLSVLRFVPQGRGEKNRNSLEITIKREKQFIKELKDIGKTEKILIRTGSPYNEIIPNNKVPCRAGFKKLVIQATGNVLPCEVYKDIKRSKWDLSIYKSSLKDILNDQKLIELKNNIKNSNCLKCPIHSLLIKKRI